LIALIHLTKNRKLYYESHLFYSVCSEMSQICSKVSYMGSDIDYHKFSDFTIIKELF